MTENKRILNAPENFEGGYFNCFSTSINPNISSDSLDVKNVAHSLDVHNISTVYPSEYNLVIIISDKNIDPVNKKYYYVKQMYEKIDRSGNNYIIQQCSEMVPGNNEVEEYIFTPTFASQASPINYNHFVDELVTFKTNIIERLKYELNSDSISNSPSELPRCHICWFLDILELVNLYSCNL